MSQRDLLELTYFPQFLKGLQRLEPAFAKRVARSALKRADRLLVSAEKSALSGYRKRTGYLKKSVKGRIKIKKNRLMLIAGLRNPKPFLKKANGSFRPRPTLYAGMWLNFGVSPHRNVHGTPKRSKPDAREHPGVEGNDWVRKTWLSNKSAVEKVLEEDMKSAIREAFNGMQITFH